MAKALMRVIKGGFAPASQAANDMLQSLSLKVGDDVMVDVKKPRNPQFFRLAHALGQMVIDNVEGFENCTNYHDALKRLQREAKIECDISTVELGKNAVAEIVTPRSMSFESMGEDRFREVYQGMCNHVAQNYWPEMTPEKIEQMAEVMIND